jgi:glutamate-1-semialdehyde 2,1-aminomutase
MPSNAPRSYARSDAMLERALKVIPLGSQTFSKSYTQYPRGAAPFFIERAQGSRAWDVDGNEYIDFNNALAAVTLGHADPDVMAAVSEQLARGTIFPLASELEIEVAERIVAAVPCAETVRFGKNGSDATAGAVRAARAFTGRDRVAVCGYHGWQDWFIGSTPRNKGVPAATRALTHGFPYNHLAALEALLDSHKGEFAAVILEPMNVAWPEEGFLQGVVDVARQHGAVAIFDETITGFRFALGGAQEYFGVTPDLACFGKGLANGFPLSAVAGRADIMAEFEEVFFSFTMGGETLSLAAAKAAIDKIRRDDVIRTLAQRGTRLVEGIQRRIDKHECGAFLTISGHPSWSFLSIADQPNANQYEIKTLYLQEVLARGILTLGTHNMSFAHSDADVDRLLDVYDEVFPILREALQRPGGVLEQLRCEPLQPLFQVR